MKSKGMRIAGGVLALVASVGGTIAGFVTVCVGAAGKALGDSTYVQDGKMASQGDTVMNLGWLGILASFLALVLGIVVLCSKSQKPAWILLACSILGIVFGGTLVAFFMVLSVAGAIFALVGGKKVPTVGELSKT
jgi:hypothetical protein